jgi:hypothetical protein
MSLAIRVSLLGSTILLAANHASAQSVYGQVSSNDAVFSSSQDGFHAAPAYALPEAPAPAAAAASSGQYGGSYGGGKSGLLHRLTYEFGGGFNAPISDSVTYGGNFTVGAGVKFNKYLSTLVEYQFLDAKLPGYLIAETGANGGYAHIWSFTIDPVVDLFPKSANDVYVTGGGGFYRKVTSFTDPEEALYCDYYYCEIGTTNAVVGHFSSNQGGVNIGAGFQHRVGGTYGDGNMRIFAEARYLDVLSPAVYGSANGLGVTTIAADTKIIPVTLGIRF